MSDRVPASASFPYGPAVAVPPNQVPGAVSDITFRPLRGENEPADCTPRSVETEGAAVRVGPGGPAGGTLTVLVARADDSLDDVRAQIARCAEFRLGGTVGTRVVTEVLSDRHGVLETDRVLANDDAAFAHVYGLVAQRGDVRVYVQNRRAVAVLSAEERAATRKLFDDAVARAFA